MVENRQKGQNMRNKKSRIFFLAILSIYINCLVSGIRIGLRRGIDLGDDFFYKKGSGHYAADKDNQIRAHLDKGGTAILAMVDHCYCDYPYGMHSLKDMYDLETAPAEFGEHGAESVLGAECLVWTEFIRENERLEELCWPRFAALAEVGWCGRKRPSYEDFRERLSAVFGLFEKYGIHATKIEGWDPDEEAAARQTAQFQMNFSEKDREEVRRLQEDI